MRKLVVSVMIAMAASTMFSVNAYAQGMRGGRGNVRVESRERRGNVRGESKPSRPNRNERNDKVNNGSNKKNDAFRPGNNQGMHPGGNNQGVRPGGNNNQGVRPGGNNQGMRPGGNNQGMRPGGKPGYRPSGNHSGYRPGGGVHGVRPGNRPVARPPMVSRPQRPGIPPHRPFARPVPPASWRPVRSHSLFAHVLGVTLGMTISNAIDQLLYNGYTVDGYGADEVYLRNVPQFDCYWPEATMYYSPSGGFVGSRFYYSTVGYDMSRYRSMYSVLCDRYGAPIRRNGAAVTWYGMDNQFVTLDFSSVVSGGGHRFYTTLSLGL